MCGVKLERNGHSGRGGGGFRTWEGKYGRRLGRRHSCDSRGLLGEGLDFILHLFPGQM